MTIGEHLKQIENAAAFAYDEMGSVAGMVAPRRELMLAVQHFVAIRKEVALVAVAKARQDRLEWVIRQMLDCMPMKRDWLDPVVEREARDLTDARKGGGRCPQ